MDIVINQPAGLGDIFFCQKIAAKLINKGHNVIWPVISNFIWIKDYIDNDICFVEKEESEKYKHAEVTVDLQSADKLFPNESVMISKYKYVNQDYRDWVDFFNFNRNKEKERELYYDFLNLKDGEQYAIKNFYFASPPNEQICLNAKNSNIGDLREICMSNIPDFTLIDWCGVIERAAEIHTVETSLNYIIEKINTTDKLYMYSKWSPINFSHIQKLFNKPWIYED